MKLLKPKDVKVGSIWRRKIYFEIEVEVTGFKKNTDTIYYKFKKHNFPDFIGEQTTRNIYDFLTKYELVYTIEGFEV